MSRRTPAKGNKAAGVQYLEACIQNAALFQKRAPDAGVRDMAAQIHAVLTELLEKTTGESTAQCEWQRRVPKRPVASQ
jgi:hypothetical protein